MNDDNWHQVITAARRAQRDWRVRPVSRRAAIVGGVRHRLAADTDGMIDAIGRRYDRTPAETLTAEIIPLADAARFIARSAARILSPYKLGWRGRPAWLAGTHGDIRRIPFGVIGIIAPGNYRLLLAGVQILQALAAGNAVIVKPAPGASAPLVRLRQALLAAGLPAALLSILSDDHAAGAALARAPIDKLVLTGSAATGRAVAADLAERLVPATFELSGDDVVFVLDDADLDLVAASIAWGLSLNAGATCIAPRRIYVARSRLEALTEALTAHVETRPARAIDPAVYTRAKARIEAARQAGWRVIGAPDSADEPCMRPGILVDEAARAPVLPGDLFAPLAALIAVDDSADAVARDRRADYALGASIFGSPAEAERLAQSLEVGVVTINDLIAPSADPRAPFSGARASGYGVTRGAEGLLAMTRPQTLLERRSRVRAHLQPASPYDRVLFTAYLRLIHGRGWRSRLSALKTLLQAGVARMHGTRDQ